MKKEAIIDAVIPAYRPGAEFRELLKRLMAQSRPLRRIIIMNTRTEVDMRTMAEDIRGAEIHELDAAKVLPVHNSKFSLSRHAWDEPVHRIEQAATKDSSLHIIHGIIGSPIIY